MKFAPHARLKPTGLAHALPHKIAQSGTGRVSENRTLRTADSRLAPPAVYQGLDSPGESLNSETRRFFEPRFGFDFSRVRVHADSSAAASARAVDATAYTVGQHIAFDSGKYDPHSPPGRQLIAHELAHTVQQSRASGAGELSLGSPLDASEKEADRAASLALNHGRVAINSQRPVSVQRQQSQAAPPRLDLGESASPFMAAAIGSMTIDQFETGKSDIPSRHQAELSRTAQHIQTLLKKYPASSIRVIGHADAVGKEASNQTLGQSRADSVQQALVGMGIPAEALHTESHGASDLLVKTAKGDGRNRRVDVRFQPSRALQGAMSSHLKFPEPERSFSTLAPLVSRDLCAQAPDICKKIQDKPPSAPPDATKVVPSDIPYELMDIRAYNQAFTSHGNRPDVAGDPRETWAGLVRKYRAMGFSKKDAAKAANSELNSTAGSDQRRDFPNAQDRFNQEWKNMNPTEKSIGPFNLPFKPFKWEF
jgi:outer membrane protein OmpA-like peptidoglycan-associated protein